jgi:TonB family protein
MKKLVIILFALMSVVNISAQQQKLFYLLPSLKPNAEQVKIDQMPEFPGGQQALRSYFARNLKYPVIAQESGIQGTARCEFIVETDGTLTDIKISESSGDKSLDKEALRFVRSMPKWKPAKSNGQPVRVKTSIPVKFSFY